MWVLGTGSERNSIMDGLTAAGWHAGPLDRVSGTPARVAAEWAARTDMELVPPRLAMERRDRIRRTGAAMGAAAVILMVAAAGLQLWGARREVDAIRERRAEIREAVTPVLAAANELVAIEERLAAIEEIQEASGSWTFALVELSVVLPDDVHLLALQAAGDTLVIDAMGRRAGDALDALRRAASLRDVRQEGPTQYELEDGTVARERFTLSAIRVPDAAPTGALDDPGGAP
jgi:Tfp pilus assembly protein PilN